jgi:hypothetical protein
MHVPFPYWSCSPLPFYSCLLFTPFAHVCGPPLLMSLVVFNWCWWFKCSWLRKHAHVFPLLLIWFMLLLSTNCVCVSTFLIMFECSSIMLQVFAFLSLVTTILVNPFVDCVYVLNCFLPLMFFSSNHDVFMLLVFVFPLIGPHS